MRLPHSLNRIGLIAVLTAGLLPLACHDGGGSSSAGSAPPEPEPILVGEVGSMTGQEATFGQSTHKGVLLAIDEINAAGGIKGRKVRDISLDDQGLPEQASTDVTQLITEHHVVAILGEVASSRSLQMAPIAENAKVPMISPSSTNVRVTQGRQYVFRVCFIDPFQGEAMAKFAHDDLKLTKVAIFRDVANDYSTGLSDVFGPAFKKLGGEIVDDESYHAGDVDFKAQLTTMKGKGPQAIFIPGYYTDVGLIARQAHELGLTVPLLGTDGWDSAKLTEIGGTALEGSYFSNHYSVDDTAPRIQAFVAAFKKKHEGEVPDSEAAEGYDAMAVLGDAMKRAPDLSGPALQKAISETKNFDGVTGTITIDAQHNAVKPLVVLKIGPGGHYQFVKRVQP